MYYAIKHMKSQGQTQVMIKSNFSLHKAENLGFPKTSPLPHSPSRDQKPLTILLVITQGVWGGSQRYVLDLARELSKNHHVTVAIGEIRGGTDLQKKLHELNEKIQIIQLKYLQRAISPIQDILALFELKKLYLKLKPDIIHLNSSKAGILGSIARWFLPSSQSCSIIYTVHGWVFLEPLPKMVKKLFTWLEKGTSKFKDAIIVLSPEEKIIALKELNIPESKIQIIPLGIETPVSKLSQTQAREHIENLTQKKYPETRWIGTIAGLYKTKGLDVLLKAIGRTPDLQKNHYFILGEGPERKLLEQIIHSNHLSHIVTLMGNVENAATLLPAFDLFVLPSRKEGLPYALLETMNCCLPIVATKVGGIPSLLKEYAGATLISPENESELIQAIAQVQPPLFHTPLQKYSLQKMVILTQELYYSVLPE